MKIVYVRIEGIHCDHCETKIRRELLKNKKIQDVTFQKNIASISYMGELSKEEIIKPIQAIDYFTKEEYISDDRKNLDPNIKLYEFIFIFFSIVLIAFTVQKIFGFNILNMIPTIDSSITYGMLVVTGLLTSIHCISMCGAINLMAVVSGDGKNSLKKPLLYNLGRLLSYTFVGGVVGFLGSIISMNDTLNGIIILGAAIIMFFMALRMLGIVRFQLPKLFRVKANRKSRNAFVIGLLNGLMPCGPLQAMQLYALSTGSFFTGALSMFLFGIGTVPLMLFVGVIFNLFQGKRRILLNKIASVLILILSLIMMNRGLLALGIDLTGFSNRGDFTSSIIHDDFQEVQIDLSYNNYGDILIQKDIPVKLVIHVDSKYLTGCNNEIVINEYGIKKELVVGENIIEFTPTKTGTFPMTCWMNMIKNTIQVVDDKDSFEKEVAVACSVTKSC